MLEVLKCMKHGTIMKPVNITSHRQGENIVVAYSYSACKKCLEENVGLMLLTLAEEATDATKR